MEMWEQNVGSRIVRLFFVLVLSCEFVSSDDSTLVKIDQGWLNGTREVLPSGNTYYSFKGIPYATPPVGNLRFKDPIEHIDWEGVRNAFDHGPVCFYSPFPLLNSNNNTDEDCLFVNVYTAETKPKVRKPVMFWIHGGAFFAGNGDSSIYGPEYLLEKGVVVVTINYRLGPLGFLTLDTAEVPGNAGLKDQVLALKWVKRNIKYFGGDENQVTLFGESAGGVSVSYHLTSPLSKGLFSKAIMQSGTLIEDSGHGSNGKEVAYRIAKYLGSNATDDAGVLSFLRSAEPQDLADVISYFLAENPIDLPFIRPVAEKTFENVDAFWIQDPWDYLNGGGEIADVPVIIGTIDGEGVVFMQTYMGSLDYINNITDFGIPYQLKKNKTEVEIKELSDKIKTFYLNSTTVSDDKVMELMYLASDLQFTHASYYFARVLANRNKSPVYMYEYTLNDVYSIISNGFKGSFASKLPVPSHACEIEYLFKGILDNTTIKTEEEVVSRGYFPKLWSNFAKERNPTPDNGLGIIWQPLSSAKGNYLEMHSTLSMKTNFRKERMQFWDKLFEEQGSVMI